MKWKLNLPESPMLVYYYLKLFGLAPFTVKNKKFYPPTILDKLYSTCLALMYLFFTLKTINLGIEYYRTLDLPPFMTIWSIIVYFVNFSGTFITLLTILSMQKKVVYVMNKLRSISDEFKNLGIEEGTHGKFFKNISVITAMANGVVAAMSVIIIVTVPQRYRLISYKYCVNTSFAVNTIIIFSQVLIYIRQRFTLLNKNLYDLLIPAAGNLRSPRPRRIFVISRNNNREETQPGSESLTDSQRIRIIKALHLELCHLVDQTTHLFSTPIIFKSFSFASQVVLYTYRIILEFRNSSHFNIFHIFRVVIDTIIDIIELLAIVHASVTTCEQGNAVRVVLFKIWVKLNPVEEVTNELFAFFNQLLHTTVTASAYGIIDLDYSFIFKIFGTVITWSIIAIQFDYTAQE